MPYGRPSDRTVEGMLRERRGTCSTKHLFLAEALAERFPETEPLIVHRVYTLERARALDVFGTEVAKVVPEAGLVDVHRYLTIIVEVSASTWTRRSPGHRGTAAHHCRLPAVRDATTQPARTPTPRSARLRPSTATRRSVSRSSRRWRP